jgi:flagellin-like protein
MYKRDDAVSPVIGVILMVAITVILAAVIAAFVFGMAGNVSKTKSVAFTAERSSQAQSHIILTNQGGKDTGDISSLTVLIDGVAPDLVSPTGATLTSIGTTVGAYGEFNGASTTGKSKVTLTAVFKDGTKQVVVDTAV